MQTICRRRRRARRAAMWATLGIGCWVSRRMDFQAHSNCKTGVGSCRLLLHASCFYYLTFRKHGMAWESWVVLLTASILEALHSVRLSWGNKNLLARLVKKRLSAEWSYFLTIVSDPIPLNCLRSSCTVDPTCAADGAYFQHSRKVKSHVSLPRRCSLLSQTSTKRPKCHVPPCNLSFSIYEQAIPQGPPTKPQDIPQPTSPTPPALHKLFKPPSWPHWWFGI